MVNVVKKAPKAFFAKLAKFSGLNRIYQRFAPKMRLGNQPDMPTITTDRLWFLRENRFLFLTRDGPIEVTLKPSFVLTGILVCMAGVAAIFYYTLIASYSAIEVMRDETIQTAEASIGKKHIGPTNTDMMTWQGYQPPGRLGPLSPQINREYVEPTRTITQLTDNAPRSSSPNTSLHEKATDDEPSDYLPMIIQGGKRVTFAKGKNTASSETVMDIQAPKELVRDLVGTPLPSDGAETSKTLGAGILAESSSRGSPKLPQANKKDEMEMPGLTTRTREYAIALLPSFMAKPNSVKPNTDVEKTEDSQKNAEIQERPLSPSTGGMIADDGLLTSKSVTKGGRVLPVVSEAARMKKMLLAYTQEIDFIRSTIMSLGISQEELPAAPLSKNQTKAQLNDQEFRSLMIELAEHRAALRKIPFKPPMLYFYISSDYGMRTHPKTGKRAFHHGIDLAGTWQENVRTTAPGRIVYAGSEGAFGKVVRVQHEFGVVTTYAHLARITVKLGDYVSEGQVVGKMGNTGRSVGAHLHYEIRVNGKSIDPDKFMKVGRQLSVAGELRQSSVIQ